MVNYIGSVRTYGTGLEIYECACGFSIGVDSSYLMQVEGVKIKCPNCSEIMQLGAVSEDNSEDATEDQLNEIGAPDDDQATNGGRVPDHMPYGTWLRENDPIAFSVYHNEQTRR